MGRPGCSMGNGKRQMRPATGGTFFPWWYDESYEEIVKEEKMPPLTPEENELARKHGLSEGQIAWRRKQWQTLRGLAAQEYAEDPSSCFLVSGECVFELAAIEKALALAGEGMEVERQRQAYDLVS